MPIIGYALSAFGTNYITWFCFERLFHRKNIATPTMAFIVGILGAIVTLQTQFAYQVDFNSLVAFAVMFLMSCCYREPWIQRLFVSFALFVCGVISEGSSWLIGQMLIPVEDMNHVNEAPHFAIVGLLGVVFQILYVIVMMKIIEIFKSRSVKTTTFILFLIVVLTYGIIDLLVTFADTAYLAPALILSALLIAAIAGCIYLFTDQLRVQRERLQLANLEEMLQDQVKHYTALYEANRQVAVQRHDLKNILLNVRSYIQVGEYEKLDKYVAGFQEKVQPSTLIDNGMPFIDAVLSAKMAEHAKIPFENDISMLTLEKIKQPQIAFILAGALDNAIEACEKSAKPFIRVHIGQQGRMISLVVENAADQPVRTAGDRLLTTKADNKAHGYGVKSMMQMAEQLHGMLTWRQEKQVFTLSVLMQDIGA